VTQDNHPYFLSDHTGKLRFTSKGLSELRQYFAMARIDINSINTVNDYYHARRTASPYFMEWMNLRAKNWPDSEQFQLLKNALTGQIKDDLPS